MHDMHDMHDVHDMHECSPCDLHDAATRSSVTPRPFPPRFRATLSRPFALAGRGLHTGVRTVATVSPGAPGGGVVFTRRDRGTRAAADWRRRVSQPLCTALLCEDGVSLVRTVEHLLSALSALEVDDAEVELDGEELPILDGSAAPWCAAVAAAGRREAPDAPRAYLRVLAPVEVVDGARRLRIEPAEGLQLEGALKLASFPDMRWAGAVTPQGYVRELAPARSFGRVRWALPAKLWSHATGRPLLRGATPRTVAAIVGGRVIGGMRFPDEFVRHRLLDLIGDLALLGAPVLGRLSGRDIGHELNHALAARLMQTPRAWERVTLD